MYNIIISDEAALQMIEFQKSDIASYRKCQKFIEELKEHPQTGTGQVERLKGDDNYWSRRVNKKDRMIYSIVNEIITVTIITVKGHYKDK